MSMQPIRPNKDNLLMVNYGISGYIPDKEGFATVSLFRNSDHMPFACVSFTQSNILWHGGFAQINLCNDIEQFHIKVSTINGSLQLFKAGITVHELDVLDIQAENDLSLPAWHGGKTEEIIVDDCTCSGKQLHQFGHADNCPWRKPE